MCLHIGELKAAWAGAAGKVLVSVNQLYSALLGVSIMENRRMVRRPEELLSATAGRLRYGPSRSQITLGDTAKLLPRDTNCSVALISEDHARATAAESRKGHEQSPQHPMLKCPHLRQATWSASAASQRPVSGSQQN